MSIIITTAIPGSGMSYIRENKQWGGYMRKCGLDTEVYSRVCGYFRPVSMWNTGKKQEFKDRKNYEVGAGVSFKSLNLSSASASIKNVRD